MIVAAPVKDRTLWVDQRTSWNGNWRVGKPGVWLYAASYPRGIRPRHQGELGAFFTLRGKEPDLDDFGNLKAFDGILRVVPRTVFQKP